jgi:periplasmic divalent cation tolerance protein
MDELADVTITAESADWLAELTRELVEARLAACGNITERVRSIYRWKGAIEDHPEAAVVLHTRRVCVPAIIARVSERHPYTTAQVLATAVVDAQPSYHQWVLDSTDAPTT